MPNTSVNTYDIGDEVVCDVVFTSAGTPADPSAIFFEYTKPDGTTEQWQYGVDVEVERNGAGLYRAILVPDDGEHGTWRYKFRGTGSLVAAARNRFNIRRDS